MALKKMIEIDETFPVVKRARLGAAPPAHDVLDNVGAPELPTQQPLPEPALMAKVAEPDPAPAIGDETAATTALKKRERAAKRAGRGIHKGGGTDARRYRTTGRTHQFGARTSPEFAESVKVMAREKNMTVGELLEDMWKAYRAA